MLPGCYLDVTQMLPRCSPDVLHSADSVHTSSTGQKSFKLTAKISSRTYNVKRGQETCVLYRQALAGKGAKSLAAPQQDEGPRAILKITQKFGRNPEVPADQDVARRVFDIANGHIRYSPSTS